MYVGKIESFCNMHLIKYEELSLRHKGETISLLFDLINRK